MKLGFDELEAFRRSLNILTTLHCNVPDAYDEDKAAAALRRFAKAWHRDEDFVARSIIQMARSEVDMRLRNLSQQAAEMLQLPVTAEEFGNNWSRLSDAEKNMLADELVSRLEKQAGR